MTLNSILFIFTCLPLLLGIYHFSPIAYRNRILIIASFIFYAWGEPLYVFLIILSMAYTYLICNWLDDPKLSQRQRRNLFLQAIAVHIFILVYLKYYGFILDSLKELFHFEATYRVLPQPLGISFYIFSVLSYIIDVYTHKIKAEKDKEVFTLSITFFPKFIMGPIERFDNMRIQILKRKQSTSLFASGVERFISGLAKKVILADTIGIIWKEITVLNVNELSIITAWIGILAYTLQIYFDFSGYSDMAIGIGKMFGFSLTENFNYPYIALSITDFWRRWHITLSTWFRDYIYIPLGGNRGSQKQHIRNLFIVWILTGLWHGASWNFIFWGLYYGSLLCLEKYVFQDYLKNLKKPYRWICTFVFIMIGWVFFASPDITFAFRYLSAMFGCSGNAFIDVHAIWYASTDFLSLCIGCICMTPLMRHLMTLCKHKKPQGEYFVSGIYALLFLLSIAYLVSQTYQSFLYIQF